MIGIALILSSCGDISKMDNYKYTYKIYYPGNTVIKTKTCYCHSIQTDTNRGTNAILYIRETYWGRHWVRVEDSSAPIELVNVEKI